LNAAKNAFFEEALRERSDPALPILCRALSEVPMREADSSEIAEIQICYQNADFRAAFSTLAAYLKRHGLTSEPVYEIDRRQFRFWREIRKITQRELAASLRVTPSAICQLERRSGYLKYPKLLVAADCFSVSPREIIIVQSAASPVADVTRLDRAQRRTG
jgi:DNA-binding XRE family transcriptional regulator